MPQPRVLDNQRVRTENLKLECAIEEIEDLSWYPILFKRQDEIRSVAAAFLKLYQRLRKNGQTMLSGNCINQFFEAFPIDQNQKYVIAFHDPKEKNQIHEEQGVIYSIKHFCCCCSIEIGCYKSNVISSISHCCWAWENNELLPCYCSNCLNFLRNIW
jgi:hypothetical protein